MGITTTRNLNDILDDMKFSIETIEKMDKTIQDLENIVSRVQDAINMTAVEIKEDKKKTGKFNVMMDQKLIDTIRRIECYNLPSVYTSREINL